MTVDLKRLVSGNKFLTPHEASNLLSDAASMTSPSVRFGQALWNILESAYPALAEKSRGTEVDFYYVTPEQEVINIFTSNFVEQE